MHIWWYYLLARIGWRILTEGPSEASKLYEIEEPNSVGSNLSGSSPNNGGFSNISNNGSASGSPRDDGESPSQSTAVTGSPASSPGSSPTATALAAPSNGAGAAPHAKMAALKPTQGS